MSTWISTGDAAELVGVSPSTIRRLIEAEDLDAKRRTRDGPWFVNKESVKEYMDEVEAGEKESPERSRDWADGYDEGYTDAEAEDEDLDDEEGEDDEH